MIRSLDTREPRANEKRLWKSKGEACSVVVPLHDVMLYTRKKETLSRLSTWCVSDLGNEEKKGDSGEF